jgi:hypothetical protein
VLQMIWLTRDQALAWVVWRDDESVERVGPQGDTTHRDLVEIRRRLARTRARYNAPVRQDAGGNEIDYQDANGRQIGYRDAEAAAPFRGTVPPIVGSPAELDRACADHRVTAYGRLDGGEREPIPSVQCAGSGPSERWTDIVYEAAELRREFPPVATAASSELEAAPDEEWLRRKRKAWRQRWIENFAERQRLTRRWISFVGLADWCASITPAVSVNDEGNARTLVYGRLLRSLLNGEFDRRGKSMVLWLDPAVITERHHEGLRFSPPRLRLTREQLDFVISPADSSPPLFTLRCCWLPRDMARQWLKARGYPWPAFWEEARVLAEPGPTGATHSNSPPSLRAPSEVEGEILPAETTTPPVEIAPSQVSVARENQESAKQPLRRGAYKGELERFMARWNDDALSRISPDAIARQFEDHTKALALGGKPAPKLPGERRYIRRQAEAIRERRLREADNSTDPKTVQHQAKPP